VNPAPELETVSLSALTVKMFADVADLATIRDLGSNSLIEGFTTNPTLMRRAGVRDYASFARAVLDEIGDRPVCFEVVSDDLRAMEREAHEIASWGEHVYVKVPLTRTCGRSAEDVIRRLARSGVRLNVTALLTLEQVESASRMLCDARSAFVSVFAGRIADTGRDPVPVMAAAVERLRHTPQLKLIWASPREVLNVFQADAIGCHVITLTNELMAKLTLVGKDLDEYSLETVRMFVHDARQAGYAI
jgi:transaldolase